MSAPDELSASRSAWAEKFFLVVGYFSPLPPKIGTGEET
jgi:hypothetical protein